MSSWKSIAGYAVMLFACALMGIAIYHLLESGTCSTTGYTRYGPAPKCSSSDTAWGIVLPFGLFVVIAAATVGAPNLFVTLGPLFAAFGVGAIAAASAGTGLSGFDVVFGGCFVIAGAGLLAVPVWSHVRTSRGDPPLAILDGTDRTGPGARWPYALAAWAAAPALALAVASLFPKDHVIKSPPAAAGSSVRTAFFQPPDVTPNDPSSMYGTDSFPLALKVAAFYIGKRGRVRSLVMVPGGVDLSVVVGPRGLRGKDISIDHTGGYLASDVVTLKRVPRTFPLSALGAAVPAALTDRLYASGRLPIRRIDHMTARPDAAGSVVWRVYPTGGGRPYLSSHGGQGPITRNATTS